MRTFQIADKFLLDGEPFTILSGAIHFFRVHPSDWHHSLYNLKAMGFNTVETYVPWNAHEPRPGEFNFSDGLDLGAFLDEAAELGLYAIVRPTPFICAEWEFGGMPPWLLADRSMRPRSNDPKFLERVAAYYDQLMPILEPRQITHGGNIIMMQVENEYGSYCEDKDYLRAIRDLMLERGVDVPLFTSDGPWRGCLRAGSLIEDDILATGNFGSRSKENLGRSPRSTRSMARTGHSCAWSSGMAGSTAMARTSSSAIPQDLADCVREALELGASVNLYMFHGGTNFYFMNGCSARHTHDLPQVASYDYDAPLNEEGNPTEKYFALQRVVHELFPDAWQAEPLTKQAVAIDSIPATDHVSLFSTFSTRSPSR